MAMKEREKVIPFLLYVSTFKKGITEVATCFSSKKELSSVSISLHNTNINIPDKHERLRYFFMFIHYSGAE